jgi:stage II sporulation protein AA (anti-sigma F factor antagonist)
MMIVSSHEKTLNLALTGEIDHHAAQSVILDIGRAVDAYLPRRCVMDMGGVSFMDSSGIAVILGTHRRLREIGGELEVVHVPRQASRVLRAAGVDRIVPLRGA